MWENYNLGTLQYFYFLISICIMFFLKFKNLFVYDHHLKLDLIDKKIPLRAWFRFSKFVFGNQKLRKKTM